MKRAYITILSSEDFAAGVKALYRGIRKFSRESFCVNVNDDISSEIKAELAAMGMEIIEETNPNIDESLFSERQLKDRWNNTLFKLVIFKNQEYDKLIYLDSDLLIRGNLDELFELPAFSAVPDKVFFPEYSRGGLNAGVMVVEPSEVLYDRLIAEVYKVASSQEVFGDQDVINSYYETWNEREELHLDASFNTCFYASETIINPKVIHFILAPKPWMWSKCATLFKVIKWCITGRKKQILYIKEYLNLLTGK